MVNERLLSDLVSLMGGYDVEGLRLKIDLMGKLRKLGYRGLEDRVYEQGCRVLRGFGYEVVEEASKVVYYQSERDLEGKLEGINGIDIVAYEGIEGYPLEVVYERGQLKSVSVEGYELKDRLGKIVGEYQGALEEVGHIQLRGYLSLVGSEVVTLEGIKKVLAMESKEYKVYMLDCLTNDMTLNDIQDKLQFIRYLGYEVPEYRTKSVQVFDGEVISQIVCAMGDREVMEVCVYERGHYMNLVSRFICLVNKWNCLNGVGTITGLRLKPEGDRYVAYIDFEYGERTFSDKRVGELGKLLENGYLVGNDVYFKLSKNGEVQLFDTKGELL